MSQLRKPRRPRIESLETRQMLAADAYISNKILYVTGSNSSDTAYVDNSGSKVQVKLNGKVEKFSKSSITEIKFYGYKGNDYFRNNTSFKVSAYGHDGNDTLVGGSGNDYLHGGGNNDKLYGKKGKDELVGDSGNDRLSGDDHDDTLYGGDGHDTLYGGSGADHLSGWDGNDQLFGGSNNDTIYGGTGHDTMDGDSGNDTMYGYTGDDTMFGGTGDDTMYGYDGNDNLYGGDGVDYLHGGRHNDGLSGGGNNSKDTLVGDSGSDRFLTQNGDKISDLRSEDVQIVFSDKGVDWNNSEIQSVDQAFHDLHRKTGNTKLLKDPWTGKPLVFVKHSDAWMDKEYGKTTQGVNSTVDNSYKYKTWNYAKFKWDHHHVTRRSREIILRDWSNSVASERNAAIDTVLHEIGHNFDASRPGEGHDQWSSFDKLHDKHRSSNNFVRDYAMTNAKEDWASTFAHYVDHGTGASNSVVRAKLKLVDDFFRSMA